jgi:hypothetical protein
MIEQAVEHEHRAWGIKVRPAAAAPDKQHYHTTSEGVTSSAPNRPGHRHALRSGALTDRAMDLWTPNAVSRL